jgi:peptidoglycan hydrolase CwlO-like protein
METTEKTLQDILDIVLFIRDNAALQSSVKKIENDVSTLKSDVSTLKSDVSTLKSDVSTLKSDVSTLKSDVSTIKVEMDQGFDSIHAELAGINNEIADIKASIKKVLKTEQEDTTAIGGSYFGLLSRIKKMEEKIKILERQRA